MSAPVNSPLREVRVALAGLLAPALGIAVHASLGTGSLHAGTGYLRPARGRPYVSTTDEGATFTKPVVAMQAILCVPNANWESAQDWIDDKTQDALLAIDLDPTLGGLIGQLVLTEVSEPGLINQQLLAIELSFRPFTVRRLKVTA